MNKTTLLIIAVTAWLLINKRNSATEPIDTTSITTPAIAENNSGEIEIKANMAAQVTISSLDNSFIITKDVPVKERLVAGKYSVTVFASGYINYEQDIIVKVGQSVPINAELQKADGDITEGAPI
jgi:hypothetical protein